MPRPTPAQFAYGSVTVICSTLAMLLLSRPSGPGVAVIAVVALVLGLLVALSAPANSTVRRTREFQGPRTGPRTPQDSGVRAKPVGAGRGTDPGAGARRRVAEPSLRS